MKRVKYQRCPNCGCPVNMRVTIDRKVEQGPKITAGLFCGQCGWEAEPFGIEEHYTIDVTNREDFDITIEWGGPR